MSEDAITNQKHNDFIGTPGNISRVPGAAQAHSGHQAEGIFPKNEAGETLGRRGDWQQPSASNAARESRRADAQADSNVSAEEMAKRHLQDTGSAASRFQERLENS